MQRLTTDEIKFLISDKFRLRARMIKHPRKGRKYLYKLVKFNLPRNYNISTNWRPWTKTFTEVWSDGKTVSVLIRTRKDGR